MQINAVSVIQDRFFDQVFYGNVSNIDVLIGSNSNTSGFNIYSGCVHAAVGSNIFRLPQYALLRPSTVWLSTQGFLKMLAGKVPVPEKIFDYPYYFVSGLSVSYTF